MSRLQLLFQPFHHLQSVHKDLHWHFLCYLPQELTVTSVELKNIIRDSPPYHSVLRTSWNWPEYFVTDTFVPFISVKVDRRVRKAMSNRNHISLPKGSKPFFIENAWCLMPYASLAQSCNICVHTLHLGRSNNIQDSFNIKSRKATIWSKYKLPWPAISPPSHAQGEKITPTPNARKNLLPPVIFIESTSKKGFPGKKQVLGINIRGSGTIQFHCYNSKIAEDKSSPVLHTMLHVWCNVNSWEEVSKLKISRARSPDRF